jgi:hypothetical protein
MKITTENFYQELESITNEIINYSVENFKSLSKEKLLQKPSPEKWSIGECLQHLVKYGEFYLTAMETELAKEKNSKPSVIFKTGYFGNKFAEMLRYKEQGMKSMKAPKIESLYFATVQENIVDIFLAQQNKHLELLAKTKNLNLAKVKVPIALTKLIKTKIGDTLRFSIYHNQRHFIQATKVLESLK